MGMMLPRIKLNYHACKPQVDSILISLNLNILPALLQEDNDQAFPVTL